MGHCISSSEISGSNEYSVVCCFFLFPWFCALLFVAFSFSCSCVYCLGMVVMLINLHFFTSQRISPNWLINRVIIYIGQMWFHSKSVLSDIMNLDLKNLVLGRSPREAASVSSQPLLINVQRIHDNSCAPRQAILGIKIHWAAQRTRGDRTSQTKCQRKKTFVGINIMLYKNVSWLSMNRKNKGDAVYANPERAWSAWNSNIFPLSSSKKDSYRSPRSLPVRSDQELTVLFQTER